MDNSKQGYFLGQRVRKGVKNSMGLTVVEIKHRLQTADAEELAVLERSLVADVRKGVRKAVEVARRRIEDEQAEEARLAGMFSFERDLAARHNAQVILGLDEVGRGPLAGPLAVGAVVLPDNAYLPGLNDSKQVKPEIRERLAEEIKQVSLAWAVEYIEPECIDAAGMTASLITAFRRAVSSIEKAGIKPDIILLDGNPLHFDQREVNVIKGDACCASIAAGSIVAKVERDAKMCEYAKQYPEYSLEACKGYASAAHIEAIKKYGLTPIHRVSFCRAFTQQTLF